MSKGPVMLCPIIGYNIHPILRSVLPEVNIDALEVLPSDARAGAEDAR